MTWGLFLDTGVIGGSFIAATLSGEFRLRRPRQGSVYMRVISGGLLMGYGAGLASGCTIGGFFSALPSLGLNAFIFGASLFVGALAGLQVIKRIG